jgi:hypothetical protein
MSEEATMEIQNNPFVSNIKKMDQTVLIIIPDMGCSSCLNTSIYFMKKNISTDNNIFYLFSNVNASKSLKLKIGLETLENNKDMVVLDNNTLFNSHYFNASYPTIVWFKEGEILKVIESNSTRIYDDLIDSRTYVQSESIKLRESEKLQGRN